MWIYAIYKKSRHEDSNNKVLETISKGLDLRSIWLGIQELKANYNLTPYHNKTREGEHIKPHDRAHKTAEHLSQEQGGNLAKNRKIVKILEDTCSETT